MPLDELLRFTAEEVTELLKEKKVGVVARRRIAEEHALEVERLPAGEAGAGREKGGCGEVALHLVHRWSVRGRPAPLCGE